MKKFRLYGAALLAAVCVAGLSACTSDDDGGKYNGMETGEYVLVATAGDANYFLQSESLETGEVSVLNSGWEEDSGTAYLYPYNKYLYRLVYAQGNAGTCTAYYRDSNGALRQRSGTYAITSRFTTYGVYKDYLVMAASGATNEYDETGKIPQYGVTFTYIDMEKQNFEEVTVVTEDLVGTGEYFTVSGIIQRDGKIYTALCPQGMSWYGIEQGHAKGYENLITETTDDDKNITNKTISSTIYPDNVWMAIYDGVDFKNPKILHDERISFATSRFRSQFYSTIAMDGNDDIYVFSASTTVSQTSDTLRTTLPSGVIRIPAGTEDFDEYYCNIEEVSGGHRMYNVWHITDDYFLLRMFDSPDDLSASTTSTNTRRLAVFKASDKMFTWVTGMPVYTSIGSYGNFPAFENGKAYVPTVTTDGADPAVYIIDPVTATATKGISCDGDSISAVGRLIKQ